MLPSFAFRLFAICCVCAPSRSGGGGLVLALNFGIIGDFGLGGAKYGVQDEIRSAMGLNDACEQLNGCNFTISAGDNMYCPNVPECLEESFEKSFTSDGPFFPSVGNHDNWGPQVDYTTKSRNKRWHFPSRWYTVKLPIDDTGYTVQLFAMDTTDGSLGGGSQLAWLENELRRSNARWKILFGHYPTVGSGRHKRVGTVNPVHDLMKKYNAQAFFAGHDHIVEMNSFEGRMLGISGGMVRGGMMLRGVGGAFRRFSLTSPSEYKPYAQDWPVHGFMTAQLSPNVLTVQVWENMGGVAYECSMTFDWITEVQKQPKSKINMFPPPEIVRAAREAERTLPRGPGGGTAFAADGSRYVGKGSNVTESPAAPPTSTTTTEKGATNPPTTTSTSTPAPALPRSPSMDSRTSLVSRQNVDLGFAVSTECFRGLGDGLSNYCLPLGEVTAKPTVGVPFTVFINGYTLDAKSRVFLSQSVLGCANRDRPMLVPGTTVRQSADANTIVFNVSEPSAVYVCLSVDEGKSYLRLERLDTPVAEHSFAVVPRLASGGSGSATPNSGNGTTSAPSPPSTSNNSLSPVGYGGTIALMVVAVIGAAALLANHRRMQYDAARHAAGRSPTTAGPPSRGGDVARDGSSNDGGERQGMVAAGRNADD